MKFNAKHIVFILVVSSFLVGWGNSGHVIINKNVVLSLPDEMNAFQDWSDFLAEHSSDADYRKSSDPDEGPKHYIDIDNYPEFITNGFINQNFDSLVALHGYSFVLDQGTLPWAILAMYDSLVATFQRYDFDQAKFFAADLGHYVGDGHMPLHLTRNYNGQFTGQYGVHSRYESSMMRIYSDQISFSGAEVDSIENVSDFVFEFMYENYTYVDSVLLADSQATDLAGSTSGDSYYAELWNFTEDFTTDLLFNASHKLAALIYTAWLEAGKPLPGTAVEFASSPNINSFELHQNYPNPFNAATTIKYRLMNPNHVELKIFNSLGREIATLVDGYRLTGAYDVHWDAADLTSGLYFYQLQTGDRSELKKFLLIK